MTFSLTETLRDQILFAMEDQNCLSCVDAKDGRVAVVSSSDGAMEIEVDGEIDIDEENYYSLPEWDSSDGFEMMENFTAGLHSPQAHDQLRRCLANRRGVFRNFKDIIRSYPEVEKKWFAFKDKTMQGRITEWYNDLCESWGLEHLEQDFLDDTENLVCDDFEFTVYDSVKDKESVDRAGCMWADELKANYSGETGAAVAAMAETYRNNPLFESKKGFVCRTNEGEFAGYVLTCVFTSSAKKTAALTDLFVIQNYRGLGIGRELIQKCLEELKNCGIQRVILFNSVIPSSMESLLSQFSFEKTDFGYLAKL